MHIQTSIHNKYPKHNIVILWTRSTPRMGVHPGGSQAGNEAHGVRKVAAHVIRRAAAAVDVGVRLDEDLVDEVGDPRGQQVGHNVILGALHLRREGWATIVRSFWVGKSAREASKTTAGTEPEPSKDQEAGGRTSILTTT